MTTSTPIFSKYILSLLDLLDLSKYSLDSAPYQLMSFSLLILGSIIMWAGVRILFLWKITRIVSLTKTDWDDYLLQVGFFRRLAHLFPGLFLYYANETVNSMSSISYALIHFSASLYLIATSFLVLQALISGIDKIYQASTFAKKAPITGFVQVTRLLVTIVTIFLIISLLIGQSPIYLLSGLTAIAAVLLLIFKDTILGFVAGIQIAANRMFNEGDWIEIPKYGVDGDIEEIGLTVVKVQNWDKTIATIPTYALTAEPVKNWQGMKKAGGRRIKRAINIDMDSISFATQSDIEAWSKFILLETYLKDKTKQLADNVKQTESQNKDLINTRKLTNVGTFRAYIENYLKEHSLINQQLTCMVRQLKPSEIGLPIEIYCFTKTTEWIEYEQTQADIFDHILSLAPIFGLSVYQRIGNHSK
ncbi:mechanosensitive ion channel family protein [Agaribacter flavus]|uniref:Mechanosensitive ion channel family protein n=1 Tax=Agaribacter flavus TaxID=1902781 RepID=A0ABV7FQW3_9ALTE